MTESIGSHKFTALMQRRRRSIGPSAKDLRAISR
jgi:hypothetical protein